MQISYVGVKASESSPSSTFLINKNYVPVSIVVLAQDVSKDDIEGIINGASSISEVNISYELLGKSFLTLGWEDILCSLDTATSNLSSSLDGIRAIITTRSNKISRVEWMFKRLNPEYLSKPSSVLQKYEITADKRNTFDEKYIKMDKPPYLFIGAHWYPSIGILNSLKANSKDSPIRREDIASFDPVGRLLLLELFGLMGKEDIKVRRDMFNGEYTDPVSEINLVRGKR